VLFEKRGGERGGGPTRMGMEALGIVRGASRNVREKYAKSM
jgi:hypothetical protein